MNQVKAWPVVNGYSLNKGHNAGLVHLRASLRARSEAIIYCVPPLGKGLAIACEVRLVANGFWPR